MNIAGELSSVRSGLQTWGYDTDKAMAMTPIVGTSALADLTRGIGQSLTGTGAAPAPARIFTNDFLPVGTLFTQSVKGAGLASFTTRALLSNGTWVNYCTIGTQTLGTIPAGALNCLGRRFRIRAEGTISANATPDYTIDCAFGAAGATVIATTGALTVTAITGTAQFVLDVRGTITTVGATGKVESGGFLTYETSSAAVTKTWGMGNSTRGTAATVDLTAAQAFGIYMTSSASHASNAALITGCSFEIVG